MKITVDTTHKTITVESPIKLEDFMSEMKRFFPEGEWKEYSLISNYFNQGYVYYPYMNPGYTIITGSYTNSI